MSPTDARMIIDALANGVDPETGELLPPDNCLNSPHVIRALYLASAALGAPSPKSASPVSRPGQAGKPWTAAEDEQLLKAFEAGAKVQDLAQQHERSKGGIASRLVRLGVIQERAEVHVRGS